MTTVKEYTRREPKRKVERARAYVNLGDAHDELDDAYLGKYEGMDDEYMDDIYKAHAHIHEIQDKYFSEKDEELAKKIERKQEEEEEEGGGPYPWSAQRQ